MWTHLITPKGTISCKSGFTFCTYVDNTFLGVIESLSQDDGSEHAEGYISMLFLYMLTTGNEEQAWKGKKQEKKKEKDQYGTPSKCKHTHAHKHKHINAHSHTRQHTQLRVPITRYYEPRHKIIPFVC